MKSILVALLLLPLTQLLASENVSSHSNFSTPALDTVKKAPTAKEIKQMKKAMKNVVPKEMADMVTDALTLGKNPDLSGLQSSMTKMNYELERNLIIEEFKNDTFSSAAKKRKARKEMNKELKELKQEYKQELKESKREDKEMEAELKD
ncbi:MAG TPA: hypothetical protein VKB19_06575 [Pedobacter sp.]|nr:hypothetical protein [Pedobacter sp.]